MNISVFIKVHIYSFVINGQDVLLQNRPHVDIIQKVKKGTVPSLIVLCHFRKNDLMPVIICKNDIMPVVICKMT